MLIGVLVFCCCLGLSTTHGLPYRNQKFNYSHIVSKQRAWTQHRWKHRKHLPKKQKRSNTDQITFRSIRFAPGPVGRWQTLRVAPCTWAHFADASRRLWWLRAVTVQGRSETNRPRNQPLFTRRMHQRCIMIGNCLPRKSPNGKVKWNRRARHRHHTSCSCTRGTGLTAPPGVMVGPTPGVYTSW